MLRRTRVNVSAALSVCREKALRTCEERRRIIAIVHEAGTRVTRFVTRTADNSGSDDFSRASLGWRWRPKNARDQDKLGIGSSSARRSFFQRVERSRNRSRRLSRAWASCTGGIVDRMKRAFGASKRRKAQVATRDDQQAEQEKGFQEANGGRGQRARRVGDKPAPTEVLFREEIKGEFNSPQFFSRSSRGSKTKWKRLLRRRIGDIRVRLLDGGFHEVDSDERGIYAARGFSVRSGRKSRSCSAIMGLR